MDKKPMTPYERRKVTEQRKKSQGLTKKNYYQSSEDIDLVKKVKAELEHGTDNKITNDEALAHIMNFYRKNAL